MPAAHVRPGLTRLVAFTGIAIFAQMLLGSWVTGHHAGLAFTDFPLMNGSVLPDGRRRAEQAIHVAHRLMSVVVLGLVLASLARRPSLDGCAAAAAAGDRDASSWSWSRSRWAA